MLCKMTGQICLNTVYSLTFKLPSNNSFRLWIKASLTLQYKQAKSRNATWSEAFVTQVQVVELGVYVCFEQHIKAHTKRSVLGQKWLCVLEWAVIHTGYSLIQTTWGSGVQGRDRLHEQLRGVHMSEHRDIHTDTHAYATPSQNMTCIHISIHKV